MNVKALKCFQTDDTVWVCFPRAGVYPGVCTEAGRRPAPCELPACAVSAREADTPSSVSVCDSDSEKDGDAEAKKSEESQRNSGEKPERENFLRVCVRCARAVLRRIVDSKYFNRGIMIAILINTLSMGVEYHEQVSHTHTHVTVFTLLKWLPLSKLIE